MMTFEVIVVLDIGSASDLESSLSSAEWMKISVEDAIHERLLSSEALSGFVHDLEVTELKSRTKGKKAICIHELVGYNPILIVRGCPDDAAIRHG